MLYQSEDALVQLNVLVGNETVWLTQAQIGKLFGVQKAAISKHLKNIFVSGELRQEAVVSILETTARDGKHYATRYYNLDAVLSIGYRVNSVSATHFRIWATHVLKDYLYRGYAIHQRINRVENQMGGLSNQVQSLVQQALPPKQGVFFDGQIFDAYQFASDLIRSAKCSILLIDNYVDDSVSVQVIAPTHDRFLLIDDSRLYTFGASFKDLGKKLFCFTLMENPTVLAAVRKLIK